MVEMGNAKFLIIVIATNIPSCKRWVPGSVLPSCWTSLNNNMKIAKPLTATVKIKFLTAKANINAPKVSCKVN